MKLRAAARASCRTRAWCKDTGLGHFPSRDYGLNKAWLDASMTACILLSWLRHLALDGKLAKASRRPCATACSTPPPGSCAAGAARP